MGPAPEAESVTLLNTTPGPVDLTGWTIIDSGRHRFPLPPTNLPAGDTVRIPLAPPVGLGNRGGIITLLDQDGLKVDGVAYTATDASREGHTIIF
ncbi:lamin tail domain-containing protein [Frankia casuarinae]|uniref:lamin tail domain-containing protein n=1 Tax=Frankia casuarinae (strain DSM 45818 / CECT 9043 / HFP020203 / CcI3) TaxID=106370 RepID=UPI0028C41672|nr:lamin tail domain-containing protein [Frankia casuarinae]